MALKGDNPVVGGTVLRRAAIQSPDFVTGVSGWIISQDGSAEFNNLVIRGTFQGTDFVINAAGTFTYSPSEGAGNLVGSDANTAGTDSFGNNYVAGQATYGANFAASLNAGSVQFYTGSLAGGWTARASVTTDSFGDLFLLAAAGRSVFTGSNTLDDGAGNMTVAGTLSVNGSGNTGNAGLPDGTIHGTSGGASAGTAHTHGPGSYAVGNGVHNHVL